MEKWIMIEVAVKVDTDIDSVDCIMDNICVDITPSSENVEVREMSVENFYGFEIK